MFFPEKEQSRKEFLIFNKKSLKFQESVELLEYEIKNKLTDEEVIYFIKEELGIYNIQEIQKYKANRRDEIIGKIAKIKGITGQQIARIVGVTYRMVQRACNKRNTLSRNMTKGV